MKARDVRGIVEDACDPFRRELASPSGSDISATFRTGFWEGVNVAMRAVEAKLREEEEARNG